MSMLLASSQPLSRLQNEMREFEDSLGSPFGFYATSGPTAQGYPAINAWEDGDDAVFEAELPGLNIENISVLVGGNELTLSGERKVCNDACKSGSCLRSERAEGSFSRTVDLPWEIDAAKVSAKLVDGVLTVRLPKSEQSKPKKIVISGV